MSRRACYIGRRRARRLLDGDPAVRAADARLASVLDALAPQNAEGNAEPAPPPEVLAAFARHAGSAQRSGRGARSGSRIGVPGRLGRSVAVKTAVAVLALSGGTMAAAAADELPGPAQRAAHELFGSWGVPAPSSTPPRHGQDPAPNTGSVLPGRTAPAGRPGASPDGSGPGSAGRGTDAGDCANPGQGNGNGYGGAAACTATGGPGSGNGGDGDQPGAGQGGQNGGNGGSGNGNGGGHRGTSSASAGVSAAPALTSSGVPTVHEPPGRLKKTTDSPGA